MKLKKLAPWNWFKDEQESEARLLPLSRMEQQYAPLTQLHQEIDRLLGDTLRGLGIPLMGIEGSLSNQQGHEAILKPNVDIEASEKEYTVTVEVPGVEEDNIQLELTQNMLIIKGEKSRQSEKKSKDVFRVERSYGAFQRVLSLPGDADLDKIEAAFKNGVLTVTLPRKAASKPEGKVIKVKSAA